MIETIRRSPVRNVMLALTTLVLAAVFTLFSGCGTVPTARREAKMLYEDVDGSIGPYHRIMGVLPFESHVDWVSKDFGSEFMPVLLKSIERRCRRVALLSPGDAGYPAALSSPAHRTSDELDTSRLSAIGRSAGINQLVRVQLLGILHEKEDRGMFWFAKVVDVARVQMQISIYHTGTGAKLLDQSLFYTIDITPEQADKIDAGANPSDIQYTEAIRDISKTMGKLAKNVMKFIPWEGYVTDVSGDRITLSAGSATGLDAGDILNAYQGDVTAEGKNGLSFSVPGKMVGTVTISEVFDDNSEAALRNGGPITPGTILRPR